MASERLTDAEEKVFRSGRCPDCGGNLLEGPSGGFATNYLCGGLGESLFNDMAMFGVDRIGVARCPKILKYETPSLFERLRSLF